MSRYVNTIDLVYSLFAFADGKKSVGQCIDDTPSADVVERQKISEALDKIALKAWKDGEQIVKLEDVTTILREAVNNG